ncbi:MAG TPA: GNAT family N-acetyltransferase [Solirubrobacteraceae bacterium]|jgi:GNAT superfamily N-acetyltransferase|nr:GNAT family N-acetyltransferase [Solirubrobacteraceae bacterium]
MIEIRHEPPDSPAASALFDEYMELVRERAGRDMRDAEHIFATSDVFSGPGAAWLVVYDDGQAVACGGLRPLGRDTGEIKRMFVSAAARRRGHARRLLAALESIARDAGNTRIRLLTTEMLPEAMALYESCGYAIVSSHLEDGHTDYWLEKAV